MTKTAPRFRDYIGHKNLIEPVRCELAGAKASGRPQPHLLITGPSGVGKTRLAKTLAGERGTRLVCVMGNAGRDILFKKLRTLKTGDYLLIDEAHQMKPADQEMLFDAIDNGRIREPKAKHSKQTAGKKSKICKIAPFTLIAATDRPGQLLNAFKRRIPTRVHLTPYPLEEMVEVVATLASELNVLLTRQATRELARVAHGLPRKARHLLERLGLSIPSEGRELTSKQVRKYLHGINIDSDGLEPRDRRYLHLLKQNGRASLATLARYVGTDPDEVESQIEPILIQKGLIEIVSSGRQLTDRGKKWTSSLADTDE